MNRELSEAYLNQQRSGESGNRKAVVGMVAAISKRRGREKRERANLK